MLRADAQGARFVLVHVHTHLLEAFAPVLVDAPHVGLCPHGRRHAVRNRLHLRQVRTKHAVLDGVAHGRAVFKAVHAAPHRGKIGLKEMGDALKNALTRLAATGHHHELAQIELGRLHVQRQIKARAARADVAGDSRHVRVAFEALLQRQDFALAGLKGGGLRHPQVHHQLGPVRGRKKLFGHVVEQGDRRDERSHRTPNHPTASAQAHIHDAAKPLVHAGLVDRLLVVMARDRVRLQKLKAQVGREQHGHKPA